MADYDSPSEIDPNFEKLKPSYIEPYWVEALTMDRYEAHIPLILENYEKNIEYTFPKIEPEYDLYSVSGWLPANEAMINATREILSKVEEILNVSFTESTDPVATNVIMISRSNQDNTAGISYFPNYYYELGMDVFISKDFANPMFFTNNHTNYDYEILVHELGHALGLKHPFEADGMNQIVLSSFEDNTFNTAMSYNDISTTFSGTFRPLDWMALTKFYGVSSKYNSGNDTYSFSNSGGVFIIDGAGIDTISSSEISRDITIDLRPGSHSHIGPKLTHITSPNQLTISHGSNIENVETGSGNDRVIGNDYNNMIFTGAGTDNIFAGSGVDIINSGSGNDVVDLSETIQERDTVIVSPPSTEPGYDTIYGFIQGEAGDILEFDQILDTSADLFPLVVVGHVPTANFSNGILRLIGSDLTTATGLSEAFELGGAGSLSLHSGASALIISAESQSTGVDQCLFQAEGSSTDLSITQLALFQGNSLDIDQWHIQNFNFIT